MMKNNILYTAPAAQDTVAAVMSREPLRPWPVCARWVSPRTF